MFQYEGKRVRDPSGREYVIRNGQPVPAEQVQPVEQSQPTLRQIVPPRPRMPTPQTPAQSAKDQADAEWVSQGRPSLPPGFRMGPGGVAERIPNLPDPDKLGPDKLGELKGQREAITAFRQNVDELDALYGQKLHGPDKGNILGMGGDRNIGGLLGGVRTDNSTFNDASKALINVLAPMMGLTGTELNSIGEIEARFGPLIPSASDSDENIQRKLKALRKLADDEERKIAAMTGTPMPQAGASEPPAAPPIGNVGGADATQQRFGSGSTANGVTLNDGGWKLGDDPVLKGVNERINAMHKAGKPTSEIAAYMVSLGIPEGEVQQMLFSRRPGFDMSVAEFRKKFPNFRGDLNVNIDDKWVPQSGTRSFVADTANSPGGAAAIAMGNVVTGNRLDNLVGLTGGNAELANIGMSALRDQHPYASLTGDVAGGASLYGFGRSLASRLPGAIGASGGTFAPRAIAGDAGMGFYIGSGADGTDPLSLEKGLEGSLWGAGGGMAGRGAINTIGRSVSPTGGNLAPVYAEGAQPSIGQRMGGWVNRAEQAFTSVPGLGGIQRATRNRAIDQAQRGAFNQALREIGDELPADVTKGIRAHTYMQNSFNKAYRKVRANLQFTPDTQFGQDFGQVLQKADLLDPASQTVFRKLAEAVGHRLKSRGNVLSGQDYVTAVSRIDAKIRAIRKNPNGDHELAEALDDLSNALDDAAARRSGPKAADELNAVRRGYAKAVTIENAARGAGEAGEFTGNQLDTAVKRGSPSVRSRAYLRGEAPMQDYATAMRQLGDTVGDSGTGERIATMGGMGALAHFLDPSLMIPYGANTAANLPGVRSAVNAALAPNRPGLRPLRRKIINRARLGSLFGVPLVEANTQ